MPKPNSSPPPTNDLTLVPPNWAVFHSAASSEGVKFIAAMIAQGRSLLFDHGKARPAFQFSKISFETALPLAVLAILCLGMGAVFRKAGASGVSVLIPGVNLYQWYRVAGMSGLWVLLPMATLGGAFFGNAIDPLLPPLLMMASGLSYVYTSYRIARKFGSGLIMSFFLIVLPPLGYLSLGFNNSEYQSVRLS